MTATTKRGISIATGTFLSLSPILKAAVLAVVASFAVQAVSAGSTFNSNAIYSGVFDVASIFTGFLATFYVFIATKGNDFVKQISATNTYAMVIALLKFTILWSVFVVAFSYVMMIVDLKDFALFGLAHAVIFLWLFNVFMVVVNFSRCAMHFMMIAEAGD